MPVKANHTQTAGSVGWKTTCAIGTAQVTFPLLSTGTEPAVISVVTVNVVTAGVTLKLTVFEVPPPGDGFITTTGKLPVAFRSEALNVMLS